MSFTDAQTRLLKARLNPDHVRSRIADGQILSYLEGWHVIAEANRIFGFGGWDRETVSCTCVFTRQTGERYMAAYTAKVRITVRAGEHVLVREGSGAGEASVGSPGQAHEVASKSAETDATKRALMTFGNPFGLSLYKGVVEPVRSTHTAAPVLVTPALEANPSPRTIASKGQPIPIEASPMGAAGDKEQAASEAVLIARERLPQASESPSQSLADPPVGPRPDPDPRIDKSVLAISEPRRVRDRDHLRFVAGQPCTVCGRKPSQAHHLKFAQATALSRKVSDQYTVPLCALHHRELHEAGQELSWWKKRRIDPVSIAHELWVRTRGGVSALPVRESSLNGSKHGW